MVNKMNKPFPICQELLDICDDPEVWIQIIENLVERRKKMEKIPGVIYADIYNAPRPLDVGIRAL